MTMTHDPGGKVKVRLDAGVTGDAFFSGPNDCYRLWLKRQWHGWRIDDHWLPEKFALWIGMNPSTADASFNDPTIRREMDFTMGENFGELDAMIKVNVCDYRSTKPEGLLEPGVIPCSKANLPLIRDISKSASKIVCAWGMLDRRLVHHAVNVETALRADGHELWCLGLTKNGSPRHPLYVKGDTKLVRFEELRI